MKLNERLENKGLIEKGPSDDSLNNQLIQKADRKIIKLMLLQQIEGVPRSFVVGNAVEDGNGMCLEITTQGAFWSVKCANRSFLINAAGAATLK